MAFAVTNTNSEDEGGGPQEFSGDKTSFLLSTPAEKLEKTTRLAQSLDKEDRRKRYLELKLAREKAQRHLESLVKKKKEKEDEVITSSLERLPNLSL